VPGGGPPTSLMRRERFSPSRGGSKTDERRDKKKEKGEFFISPRRVVYLLSFRKRGARKKRDIPRILGGGEKRGLFKRQSIIPLQREGGRHLVEASMGKEREGLRSSISSRRGFLSTLRREDPTASRQLANESVEGNEKREGMLRFS